MTSFAQVRVLVAGLLVGFLALQSVLAQPASKSSRSAKTKATSDEKQTDEIISKMKDLQILLGTWRGITQKVYGGTKAVDETDWVWDFQSEPGQPALVMESQKSPHYRQARLSFLPEKKTYQLELTDTSGNDLKLQGGFTEEVSNEAGEGGKPQKTYKLELVQVDSGNNETMKFVINQQNNNRYLLEIYRQRGSSKRFVRVDTVSTQREGTSFASSEEDYGDKTCIISAGLGTMSVSHAGETYYVCCTGCKAAFEEDPMKWITRFKEQHKK